MSQAVAAVGISRRHTSTQAIAPVVFVDGVPDPDLSVVSMSLYAPLDDRVATLVHSGQRTDGLAHAEITLAVPHALSDGEVRWQVLLSGSVSDDERDQSAKADDHRFVVRDRLSAALVEPMDVLRPFDHDEVGLAVVMGRLGALVDAELVWACDAGLLQTTVSVSSSLTVSIASRLRSVLTGVGLAIEQTLSLDGRQVRRTLTVVPGRSGRRVALPWSDREGRGGLVRSVSVDREARPPRRWVARGDRPVIEDTFALQAGWDPALQGQPDSDYGRQTSSDFSVYGSVYRAWVLNEDGAYNGSPFHLGSAFDVGALFEQPGTIDEPMRFGLCLTQSAAGRRLSPIIESSTDSGATWSAYPGQAQVMTDRAGVQLNDDVLPVAIMSAAKAGTLRLRITASLSSPDAIEVTRWDGNPFAGPAPTRVLDFDDQCTWRFVASTSIHKATIDAGQLQADSADDRRALRLRLQDHIAQQPGADIVAKLALHGAWTALRPGDRVSEALGPGLAIDGNPSNFGTRDARIQRIDLAFGVANNAPRTQLTLD